ncbi:helix-turn-helix domain-containing protein [Solibacillus sp. FSL W7-1436]|uniref:helix-turn-helix transcriptional regulator n=1 Tax=Solibacillus sp. FSL W7-1436 TaxID=2921705 RepID=UPI0030F5E581
MIHPIKISSTFADETRFAIYEFMLQQKQFLSVQDIADQFKIHSNVARLHLTKLAEIGAISSEHLKTGKGGRPGRVYKAKQEGINLSIPRRDTSSLIKWSLELIRELGEAALSKAQEISYRDGRQSMLELMKSIRRKSPLSFDEKLAMLTKSATLIGYIPEVIEHNQSKSIIFSLYNCPFQEQISNYGEIVCQLHESYLYGQVDALFDRHEISKMESMVSDCDFCKYKISVHN